MCTAVEKTRLTNSRYLLNSRSYQLVNQLLLRCASLIPFLHIMDIIVCQHKCIVATTYCKIKNSETQGCILKVATNTYCRLQKVVTTRFMHLKAAYK
ncbi:hypothetical protein QL285_017002 [Trifolium repens]|nr:hypothetical protein QL285_017002 [Trifolium repens]